MIIIYGNIWDHHNDSIIGVPTNGYVTKNDKGVMGKGIAAQSRNFYPDIEFKLGKHLIEFGNTVGFLIKDKILAIPTKTTHLRLSNEFDKDKILNEVKFQYKIGDIVPGFYCKSDLNIIKKSLIDLINFVKLHDLKSVHIPMLGCVNGGLIQDDVLGIMRDLVIPDSITLVISK